MKIENGWLTPEPGDPTVVTVQSVRSYGLSVSAPLGVVWHYTGGVGGPQYAANLAERIRTYDRATDRPASWHLLIAKNGAVYQSVSLLRGSWHTGRGGEMAGKSWDNVNKVTIGIELENAGRLKRIGAKWFCWPYWEDKIAEIPDKDCEVAATRSTRVQGEGYFDSFPESQIHTAISLTRSIAICYSLSAANLAHGHKDYDPIRKEDPGPLFKRVYLPTILSDALSRTPHC